MSKLLFPEWLKKEGITLTEDQMNQFDRYYQLLIEWNNKMNLTSITEEDEVYEKHFYDSLTASFAYSFHDAARVVDIGAGAGFPSLPINICFPHLHIVIIDSLKKRIAFLEELVRELQLKNVTLLHGRAEDYGRDRNHRDSYDVAIARAVARMPVLTELCTPFVKTGGVFLAMKGASGIEEQKEANKAIQALQCKWEEPYASKLPNENSKRYILTVKKMKATPKAYPRKAGTPAKKPIL
ncbi:16S rRNA (guanine(527)-N(7))-methyltransferase RsmG [Alteribacillus iranensis]|uniref:Ribosomal RNA small subunit methyltransferase G n=1 Tax=Alteribacillus iranensis TaxID=930128 RepID=A0A1I2C5N1_9BACI|nr:16S rRNA (guanine(527)-N(7))-methyltransferase RsmG [Alteribacillus iranensis]SFE63498.1 16S rRNA m(7)G-527 methyltransferase [Alteribacillus iranensis]